MTSNASLSYSIQQFICLYKLIKPYHRLIYKGMVVGPIIGLLSIVPPYFTKLLFDNVAVTYDVTLLTVLVVGIVVFSLVSILSESILQYYSDYLNIKLESVLQMLFFDHLQNLPYKFFYQRKMGEISSRFQDINIALGSIHSFLHIVVGQGVYLLIAPIFLLYLNWKLALVAMISLPFSSLAIYLANNRLRNSWRGVAESHADVEATQVQMLNQILSIKSLQLEPYMYRRCSEQYTRVLDTHLRAQSLRVSLSIFEKVINALNLGLLTWLGWYYISNGSMTLGDYVAFAAYVGFLRNPILQVIELFANFQRWSVYLNRMFEYFDTKPEQPLCSETTASLDVNFVVQNKIELKNINYAYPDGNVGLKNVSLDFYSGSIVAFVGLSGSGKSTLLRLIARIEHDYQGTILIDGLSIKETPVSSYRSQLGVAWQDGDLFHGTLHENFTIGKDINDREWLNTVIKLCCLEEFVASLQHGLDTVVGEKGSTLSSGQKQRIALVRALAKKPSILVLDEALSNLDMPNEAKVLDNIFTYAKSAGMTVLYVTHRIPTTKECDKIFLLESGQLVDSGSYQYLREKSKHYERFSRHNEFEGV